MAHYKSPTPKRHYAYSNTKTIHKIDKGVLQGWKKSNAKKVVTAERYVDGSGRKRYKGTGQLRTTETLDSIARWYDKRAHENNRTMLPNSIIDMIFQAI